MKEMQAEFWLNLSFSLFYNPGTFIVEHSIPSLAGLPKSTSVEDNWTSPGPVLYWGRQWNFGELSWQHDAIWGIYSDFVADGVFQFISYEFTFIVLPLVFKDSKVSWFRAPPN